LDPVKDLGTQLEALRRCIDAGLNATLLVIGDGPQRAQLESQTAALSLQGHVRMLGARSDVRQLLPAFDIYLNSSTSEGISLTILEAMAAGLPVVASHVGGTPEVVIENVTGVLIPARSPESLADAILDLSKDAERCSLMGAAGRRRVEAHFTMDRMVAEYTAAYRACIGEADT
jgi:glycosyltransferase involved in cell wall biosynthesis